MFDRSVEIPVRNFSIVVSWIALAVCCTNGLIHLVDWPGKAFSHDESRADDHWFVYCGYCTLLALGIIVIIQRFAINFINYQ